MFDRLLSIFRPDSNSSRRVPDGGVAQTSETDSRPDPSIDNTVSPTLVDDNVEQLLDGLHQPTFVLDADGRIVGWNEAIAELTGAAPDEAIGHDTASEMFYPDGRRAKTLADKVLDTPTRAHEEYDVDLVDPDRHQVADTSTMIDQHGDEKHIRFAATPQYRDGRLVGVIETVVDQTAEVERRQAVEAIVRELTTTLNAVRDGNLDTRANLQSINTAAIDDNLLDVAEALNAFIDEFQALSGEVEAAADRLVAATEQVNENIRDITDHVESQDQMLDDAVAEMESFSARMEEVAATAKQVDDAADEARTLAEDGVATSRDARQATKEVSEIGNELVADIEQLEAQINDIDEIVEVIDDVADQTNLLALNANIEAARATTDGGGFGVVADEIKTLANQTQQHTDEITETITTLRERTDQTVDSVRTARDQIEGASEQLTDMLAAFENIADAVEEAAEGITEVSRANDEQAASVEEVTATLEHIKQLSTDTRSQADEVTEATDQQTYDIEELQTSIEQLREGREMR